MSAKKGRLILAEITAQEGYESSENSRLRVVSNFGDGNEAGEYTRAHEILTRRDMRGAPLRSKFRARVRAFFAFPTIAITKTPGERLLAV